MRDELLDVSDSALPITVNGLFNVHWIDDSSYLQFNQSRTSTCDGDRSDTENSVSEGLLYLKVSDVLVANFRSVLGQNALAQNRAAIRHGQRRVNAAKPPNDEKKKANAVRERSG